MIETTTTIATIPAILALVNLAKTFGVTGKWSALLAVILGVAIQAAEYGVTSTAQTPAGWYGAIATGLVLGLSAAGLYDVARTVAPSDTAPLIITPLTQDPILDDGYRQVDLDAPDAIGYLDGLDGISTQPERAAD